ncbi:MAG: PaaI family thioesterase [Candidatus Nanopelagicales bacterium]
MTEPKTLAELAAQLPADQAEVALALGAGGPGALAERMGIELLEVGAERTSARMPVAGNTQPYGLLHGGASVVLAETVGSIAAAMFAGPGRIAVGIEVSAAHHKAVRAGHVTAVATPLARNRTLATYGIEITDDHGAVTCTARLTCFMRHA